MDKEAIEKILREEMVTIGVNADSAKTGQMWAFDAERIAKLICKLPEKPPLLSEETTFQPQRYRADMLRNDKNG